MTVGAHGNLKVSCVRPKKSLLTPETGTLSNKWFKIDFCGFFFKGIEISEIMWYNKLYTVQIAEKKGMLMNSAAEGKYIFCGGIPYLPHGYEDISGRNACCFTGHRPDKMPSGEKLRELGLRVQTVAEVLMNNGVDTFIIGMAPGFDLFAAEILMKTGVLDSARLICAMPYRKDHIRQAEASGQRKIYEEALRRCAAVPDFFENYCEKCYKVRNRFMVNCSSHIIAYLKDRDAMKTGTGMTVRMSEKKVMGRILIYGNEL